eukprot:scaffold221845_cov29-Tisochrysis_lutea.AAC.3
MAESSIPIHTGGGGEGVLGALPESAAAAKAASACGAVKVGAAAADFEGGDGGATTVAEANEAGSESGEDGGSVAAGASSAAGTDGVERGGDNTGSGATASDGGDGGVTDIGWRVGSGSWCIGDRGGSRGSSEVWGRDQGGVKCDGGGG